MSERYKCYQQGYMDVCLKFHDRVPSTMLLDEDQFVDEDSDAFDRVSYLQGQMNALLEHIKREDAANTHSANVASCLANGIIPD